MKKTAIALLTLALTLGASADVHLLPAGEFTGRDGRPGNGLTWKLSDAQGQALAARLNARHATVHFNLDYEHQAMLSEKNGQPAPASGWASSFEWRTGKGLFAKDVQWTAKARQMIDDKEYKYISPVIAYNKVSGEVFGLINASLTNIPALELNPVAQEALAQLNARFPSSTPESTTMNEVLKALLASLGLNVSEETTKEQAVAAVTALKAQAAQVGSLTVEIAALKSTSPDPTKWVSLESFNQLNAQVAQLSATHAGREVDELISAARAQGKCTPVVEAVWRDVGKADVAMLRNLIEKTPANPALSGQMQSQVPGARVAADMTVATLSAEDRAMCRHLGLSETDYLATLKANAEQAAAGITA